MNIKEYILSGILEAYALGDLSELERKEVEKNLVQYPELKEELNLIEEAQEEFLMQLSISPRTEVKENLFAKVDQQKPEGKVVPMNADQTGRNFWKFAAAASITLAVISSYLAYNYYDKWKNTQYDLSNLMTQNQQMAHDYNQVNQRIQKIEEDIKVIDNPAFERVIMKGTEQAPNAMAYVYWNESTKEVYLDIRSMKELARKNQYQLWAIIDGKPVDAGVFDGNLAGLVKMKEIGTGAAAFAVTVEPRGGKASPTLETMQVVGNVVKG